MSSRSDRLENYFLFFCGVSLIGSMILIGVFGPLLTFAGVIAIYKVIEVLSRNHESGLLSEIDHEYIKGSLIIFAMAVAFGSPGLVLVKYFDNIVAVAVGIGLGIFFLGLVVKVNEKIKWLTDNELVSWLQQMLEFIGGNPPK